MNPILIPTKDIPPAGLDIHWRKTGKELDFYEGGRLLGPVEIDASVIPRGGIYLFRGRAAAEIELECSLCLKKFPLSIRTEFVINYEPVSFEPEVAAKEVELGKDDLDITYYRDDLLPIGEDIREAVLLAIPSVPRCFDACLGLCPVCGRNRNEIQCGCETDDEDERWRVLGELKNKMEDK